MDTRVSIAHPWIPLLETMPSVLHKVQNLNKMNASDMRRTFSTPSNTFNGKIARLGYSTTHYNFPNIEKYTGWKQEVFDASFPMFLLGFSDKLLHDNFDNFNFDPNLRICKPCYRAGYHLIFHQSLDWRLCPIHLTKLQNYCPTCNSDYGEYRVSFDLKTAFSCLQCSASLSNDRFIINENIERKKRTIHSEYSNWCSKLRKIFAGKKHVLSEPNNYTQIRNYYDLLGGPHWLSRCLNSNPMWDNAYTATFSLKNSKTFFEQPTSTYKTSSQLKLCHKKQLRQLLSHSLAECKNEIEDTFVWVKTRPCSPINKYGNCVTFRFQGCHGVAQTLQVLDSEVRNYLSQLDAPIYSSSFWIAWLEGPGQFVQRDEISHKEHVNSNLIISSNWFKCILFSIYKYILYRSYVPENKIIWEFTIGQIYSEMERFSGNTVIFRKRSRLNVSVNSGTLDQLGMLITETIDKTPRNKLKKRTISNLINLMGLTTYQANAQLFLFEQRFSRIK